MSNCSLKDAMAPVHISVDTTQLLLHGQDVAEVLKGPMVDPVDGAALYRTRNEHTGQSVVHILAQNGRLELLRHLVAKRGLSMDTAEGKWGATPLHLCAANGRAATARWLLRAGCPRKHLAEENFDGRTPKDVAKHYAASELEAILAAAGLRRGDEVSATLGKSLKKRATCSIRSWMATSASIDCAAFWTVSAID